MEHGETIKENVRHRYLPGGFIYHYGYGRHDFRDCHCTRRPQLLLSLLQIPRKPLPPLCSGYRLFGVLFPRGATPPPTSFAASQRSRGHLNVSPDWLSAANPVGATGGKIISPQSIAIRHISRQPARVRREEILKATIPYALAYVVITGIIVYIFS